MKKYFSKIYRHRHFLIFIALFAYVQSIYNRIGPGQTINAYTFTPEAALSILLFTGLLFLIMQLFIQKWQQSEVLTGKAMWKIFGSSLTVYMLTLMLITVLIAVAYDQFTEFDNIARNLNSKSIISGTIMDLLNGIVYGSFFLAYYYHLKSKSYQNKVLKYHRADVENKLYQLKTQLNPHFLFNNLNILDQLIEEDKEKASDFLNQFAEIYRYVLQVSDKKLIPINEEIDFIVNYFRLFQYKYGNAYQLKIEAENTNGFLAPLTLQLLVENAIKHNTGSIECPVLITINISKTISVSNNLILKRNLNSTLGNGLKNIDEQYKLLAQKPIVIQQTDQHFTVTFPIIQNIAP